MRGFLTLADEHVDAQPEQAVRHCRPHIAASQHQHAPNGHARTSLLSASLFFVWGGAFWPGRAAW
jgi:hypothetical protein